MGYLATHLHMHVILNRIGQCHGVLLLDVDCHQPCTNNVIQFSNYSNRHPSCKFFGSRPLVLKPGHPPVCLYNSSTMTIIIIIIIIQDDETALHIAAYHGYVDVVKVLTANQDRFVINARDKVSQLRI